MCPVGKIFWCAGEFHDIVVCQPVSVKYRSFVAACAIFPVLVLGVEVADDD